MSEDAVPDQQTGPTDASPGEDEARGLGIDPTEPLSIQAMNALMIAQEEGLLAYHWVVHMSDPVEVDTLRFELGADAQLPIDGDLYYKVVVPFGKNTWQPILVPERDVRPFVLGLAVAAGNPELLHRLTYRIGVVPL